MRTTVTARAHKHRNKRYKCRYRRTRILIFCQNSSRYRRRQHQYQQPKNSVFGVFKIRRFEIRFLRWIDSRHSFDILCCLVLHNVDCVVKGYDTDKSALVVNNRHCYKVVFIHILCNVLFIAQSMHAYYGLIHYIAHFFIRLGKQKIFYRQISQQFSVVISDITSINRFSLIDCTSYTFDCVTDCHFRSKTDIIGRHKTSGTVLGIFQYLIYHLTHIRLCIFKNTFHHICRHFLNYIRRVINVKLIKYFLDFIIRKTAYQKLLLIGVHKCECIRRQIFRQKSK